MGKKRGGREYLVGMLKKRGFSRRQSVKVLNVLFAEIKKALASGEEVDFALGKLKVVRHKHRTQAGRFLNRETTIYKQPFTVALEADSRADWWLVPFSLPPKPGSPPDIKPTPRFRDPFFRKRRLPPKSWLNKNKNPL